MLCILCIYVDGLCTLCPFQKGDSVHFDKISLQMHFFLYPNDREPLSSFKLTELTPPLRRSTKIHFNSTIRRVNIYLCANCRSYCHCSSSELFIQFSQRSYLFIFNFIIDKPDPHNGCGHFNGKNARRQFLP